jgi:hypothetical protein
LLGAVALDEDGDAVQVPLYKDFGETRIEGQGLLNIPAWDWGGR